MAQEHPIMGWFVAGFFGLCSLVSFANLLFLRGKLVLCADGFEFTQFWQTSFTRWKDINGLAVVDMQGGPFVGFERLEDQNKKISDINRALAGRSAMLPDTYGFRAEELAAIMERYRNEALMEAWAEHGRVVDVLLTALGEEFESDVTIIGAERFDEFEAARNLPDGLLSWATLLVLAPSASEEEFNGRIICCVDVLSPESRWSSFEEKAKWARTILGAERFRLYSADGVLLEDLELAGLSV